MQSQVLSTHQLLPVASHPRLLCVLRESTRCERDFAFPKQDACEGSGELSVAWTSSRMYQLFGKLGSNKLRQVYRSVSCKPVVAPRSQFDTFRHACLDSVSRLVLKDARIGMP